MTWQSAALLTCAAIGLPMLVMVLYWFATAPDERELWPDGLPDEGE